MRLGMGFKIVFDENRARKEMIWAKFCVRRICVKRPLKRSRDLPSPFGELHFHVMIVTFPAKKLSTNPHENNSLLHVGRS